MSIDRHKADEQIANGWWKHLTPFQRDMALRLSQQNVVAEIWRWQKSVLESGEGPNIKNLSRNGSGTPDEESCTAGYVAGHLGESADSAPPGMDHREWISGLIEGEADRDAGRIHPLSREPETRH